MNDHPLNHLFDRPTHYLLDFAKNSARFVPMTRETYRQSIFTDYNRIVTASTDGWTVDIAELLNRFEAQSLGLPPPHHVFHVAHCGSTLLARALEVPNRTLVYREPFALRQLGVAHAAQAGGPPDPQMWRRLLNVVIGLLSRRFESTETTIVKANVPVNFALQSVLQSNPNSAGILLYSDLESFLIAALRAPERRSWTAGVVQELAAGIQNTLGLDFTPTRLSVSQAAASLYAAQMQLFTDALSMRNRLRSLNCESLYSRPLETLTAVFELFGVEVTEHEANTIVSGELFSHHAKIPSLTYNTQSRSHDMARWRRELHTEIDEGIMWIENLDNRIPMTLPDALLAV